MSATRPYELISALPGVVAHAAYIGLSGAPLAHGKPVSSFLVNSLNGSLDGEYFGQDRATVLAGRLPPQGSTSTVVLTPAVAEALGTGVGGTVSYKFQPVDAQRRPAGKPFTRSFRVAAIVSVPPALVDESDQEEGSIFPPGATRQLLPEYFYAWIGLRLAQGTAGTADLQKNLARPPCRRPWGRHLGSGRVSQSRSPSSPRRWPSTWPPAPPGRSGPP